MPGDSLAWLLGTWGVTRAALLLFVFRVYAFPGPDVTSDVSVIYRGWYEVLRQGTFPLDDVTWRVPAGRGPPDPLPRRAAPSLSYAHAFFVLACLADVVVLALLVRAGGRPGRSPARGLGVGGGRAAARADGVRPLRRDGDRGRRGGAARRGPAPAGDGRADGGRGRC